MLDAHNDVGVFPVSRITNARPLVGGLNFIGLVGDIDKTSYVFKVSREPKGPAMAVVADALRTLYPHVACVCSTYGTINETELAQTFPDAFRNAKLETKHTSAGNSKQRTNEHVLIQRFIENARGITTIMTERHGTTSRLSVPASETAILEHLVPAMCFRMLVGSPDMFGKDNFLWVDGAAPRVYSVDEFSAFGEHMDPAGKKPWLENCKIDKTFAALLCTPSVKERVKELRREWMEIPTRPVMNACMRVLKDSSEAMRVFNYFMHNLQSLYADWLRMTVYGANPSRYKKSAMPAVMSILAMFSEAPSKPQSKRPAAASSSSSSSSGDANSTPDTPEPDAKRRQVPVEKK